MTILFFSVTVSRFSLAFVILDRMCTVDLSVMHPILYTYVYTAKVVEVVELECAPQLLQLKESVTPRTQVAM